MATFTRVNGGVGAPGALRSVNQQAGYIITCKDTGGSAVNIQASTGVDGVIESVIREVAPLMYDVKNANGGVVHVIVDGHAQSAASFQARIRALGTIDSIDLTGTTVALATAMTLS
jgi:hypothetical protein